MKRCPKCRRDYYDDSLLYCLDDGSALLEGLSSGNPLSEEPPTAILSGRSAQSVRPQPSQDVSRSSSIAVLPFAHMSSDPDDDYFCDGLAEELINALAKVEGLKVAARTSAFSFKRKDIDIAEIGRQLGVETVLEGSVRKSGNRLRITAQLVGAADGYHIWSERFDREMRDVFEIQDEITLAVVTVLKSMLLGDRGSPSMTSLGELKHFRTDLKAYELYLRGKFFFNKFTSDDFFRAIDCYEKAIEIDPEFAAAYSGLADAHVFLTEFGPVPPHEGMPKAKEAALKALALDPSLPEAHSSLGIVIGEYEFDFTGALRELSTALQLNANNSMALQYYAALLSQFGRHEEAEVYYRKVEQLDPLSPVANWIRTFGLFFWRRYDECLERARKLLELEPNFLPVVLVSSFCYQMKEEYPAAVSAYARFLELGGLPDLSAAARAAFEHDGWEAFLRAMTAPEARNKLSAYISAAFFTALGDRDAAFQFLEESYARREGYFVMLKVDPRMDPLRDDSRFQSLLNRLKLPD